MGFGVFFFFFWGGLEGRKHKKNWELEGLGGYISFFFFGGVVLKRHRIDKSWKEPRRFLLESVNHEQQIQHTVSRVHHQHFKLIY